MASSEEQMKMTPNKKVGNIDNAENNDSIVERANHSDDGVAALIPSMETMSTREREEITQNENVEQKHKKNDQIDTTRMEELENMFSEILTQIQQLKSPSELEKITRQTAADLYAKAKDCKLLLDDVITKAHKGSMNAQDGNSSPSEKLRAPPSEVRTPQHAKNLQRSVRPVKGSGPVTVTPLTTPTPGENSSKEMVNPQVARNIAKDFSTTVPAEDQLKDSNLFKHGEPIDMESIERVPHKDGEYIKIKGISEECMSKLCRGVGEKKNKCCLMTNIENIVTSKATKIRYCTAKTDSTSCNSSYAIYLLECNHCDVQYVGQTTRPLCVRMVEHRTGKNSSEFNKKHHRSEENYFTVTVLEDSENEFKNILAQRKTVWRRILEGGPINEREIGEDNDKKGYFELIGKSTNYQGKLCGKKKPDNIQNCCSMFNLQHIVTSTTTGKRYCTAKTDNTSCQSSYVIYLLECNDCKVQCVEQTIDKLATRLNTTSKSQFNHKESCKEKSSFTATVLEDLEIEFNNKLSEKEIFWIKTLVTFGSQTGLNNELRWPYKPLPCT